MKAITVDISLWKWEGIICTGGTHAEFVRLVKQHSGMDIPESDQAVGRSALRHGQPWAIWVEDPKDIATFVHEAFHVVSYVLQSRGLRLSDDSEEAFTYTLDGIVDAFLHAKPKQWRTVKG